MGNALILPNNFQEINVCSVCTKADGLNPGSLHWAPSPALLFICPPSVARAGLTLEILPEDNSPLLARSFAQALWWVCVLHPEESSSGISWTGVPVTAVTAQLCSNHTVSYLLPEK